MKRSKSTEGQIVCALRWTYRAAAQPTGRKQLIKTAGRGVPARQAHAIRGLLKESLKPPAVGNWPPGFMAPFGSVVGGPVG